MWGDYLTYLGGRECSSSAQVGQVGGVRGLQRCQRLSPHQGLSAADYVSHAVDETFLFCRQDELIVYLKRG